MRKCLECTVLLKQINDDFFCLDCDYDTLEARFDQKSAAPTKTSVVPTGITSQFKNCLMGINNNGEVSILQICSEDIPIGRLGRITELPSSRRSQPKRILIDILV